MEVAVRVRDGYAIEKDAPHPGGEVWYAPRRRKSIPVGATVTRYGMSVVCEWRNARGLKESCLLTCHSESNPPPKRVVGF